MNGDDAYWYTKIVEEILSHKEPILLVVDPADMLNHPSVRQELSRTYNIFQADSEIRARKLIKEKSPVILVYSKREALPYAFTDVKGYPVLELDVEMIFPYLSPEPLKELDPELFQDLYIAYRQKMKTFGYSKLDEDDTRRLIEEAVNSEDIHTRKDVYAHINRIKEILASEEVTSIQDWLTRFYEISREWGRASYLMHSHSSELDTEDVLEAANRKLFDVVGKYYNDTTYIPDSPMHWNIMKRVFASRDGRKRALICFDAMGLEEWYAIKEYLIASGISDFEESFSYAIIPTETNLSRTSLFAGMTPKEIIEHENITDITKITTRFEEDLFKNYLKNNGYSTSDYEKETLPADLKDPYLWDFDSIGLTFTFVDEMLHSPMTSKKTLINRMKNEVLPASGLDKIISGLLENGFRIFITSDHGNTYSQGIGKRLPSALALEKSSRYVISRGKTISSMESEILDNGAYFEFPHILGDYHIFVMKDRLAMGSSEKKLTHGGISIEELIVPFIEVRK